MLPYIYLTKLAGENSQTSKSSDKVWIMTKILHIYIMVQTAWKARLTNTIHESHEIPVNQDGYFSFIDE